MLWKGQENWSQSQSEFCCYLTVWPWAGPSVLWSVCPLCLSGMGATLQWPLNISSCSIVQGDAQDPNENASTSTVDYRKWRWYSSYIKVRMCIPAECCLIARGQERPRASRLLLSSFPKAIAKCTCSDQKPPTTSLIPWKQWIQIRVSAGTVCIEYFTGSVGIILLHN